MKMFKILLTSVCIFSFSYLQAQNSCLIGSGLREDQLNWNISGGCEGPNILSELKWKDLSIWEIYAEFKFALPHHIYLRFNGDYGRIFDGRSKDVDYLENNRTNPFSISASKANKGEVFDLSTGVGYICSFFQKRLCVIPLFGFSHHEQHLRIIHGKQILDLFDPLLVGSIPNLHSNYKTQWYGPWLGVDVNLRLYDSFEIESACEYHLALYNATGHWNLRDDFIDDFEHSGCSQGFLIKLGTQYEFYSHLKAGVLFKYQLMQLTGGNDTIFFFDEGNALAVNTRLNRVNWQSYSLLFTMNVSF